MPGNVPRARKLAVWRRDNFRCHYCKTSVVIPEEGVPDYLWATVDHKIPRSKMGRGMKQNLVTACRSCNVRKGSKPYSEFIRAAMEGE